MTNELSNAQLEAIDKIKKLLNLAAKNSNVHEAEAAMARAQKMLAEHNLDAATVEHEAGAKEGKREEAKVNGGHYAFQREIWKAVAELNFCIYWNQKFVDRRKRNRWTREGRLIEVEQKAVQSRRHALVGRIVNTRSTVAMAQYLEAAIERVLDEHLAGDSNARRDNANSNWAWSFRKGVAGDLVHRLQGRRREVLAEERAAQSAKVGEASSGRSLTLATFSKSEADANNDFIHGEGWSARQAAEKAKEAGLERRMEQAYAVWAAANPKVARSKFRFDDPATGKVWFYGADRGGGGRGSRGGDDGIDYGGFRAGREAAKKIGLDPQAADNRAKTARITGSKDIHL